MSTSKLLVAMAAALTLAVAGCGESPDEHNEAGASESAGSGIDRAFAIAMIPHHESAVDMATIAQQRGESEFIKALADDIVRTQNEEIEALRAQDAELDQAGVKAGDLGMDHDMMGMDGDTAMLEDAEPFDAAFIDMMIPHHEGAIAMAKVEIEKGADPELKTLAQDIIDAQEREIADMKEHGDGTSGSDSMEDMDHSG